MASSSFQNEIPPARVNIQLSVDTGNAQVRRELPLKLLVVGDFTKREESQRLADREKIPLHKDNFDQVMHSLGLEVRTQVNNCLSPEGGDISIALRIESMKSFTPYEVARQVPELGRLMAARNLLKDLGSNLLDNRDFRKRMEALLRDRKSLRELRSELDQHTPVQS